MVICGTPGGRPLQSCVYIKFVQALRICSIVGVDVLGDPFKFAQALRSGVVFNANFEFKKGFNGQKTLNPFFLYSICREVGGGECYLEIVAAGVGINVDDLARKIKSADKL